MKHLIVLAFVFRLVNSAHPEAPWVKCENGAPSNCGYNFSDCNTKLTYSCMNNVEFTDNYRKAETDRQKAVQDALDKFEQHYHSIR
jgi:hypothetical protein